MYKDHINCRVCGSDKLTPYLDLGMLPLSNNLASSALDPIHNQRYPLKVLLCEHCGLSQLSVVIDPKILFGHYVYRSSISKGYVDHCEKMAIELQKKHGLNEDSFHIDIAGNDGALLEQFKNIIGHKVLNVDPAENMSALCHALDIPTLTFFWGMEVARRVVNGFGKADLITATNVFAHVDDVKEFIQAVKHVLKPSGVLVLEFPYLIDFIENGEFDTVYFEHLSYFSIYPLTLLCHEAGLSVLNVEQQDIHGGSVRVTIGYGEPDETVVIYVKLERKYYSKINKYHWFAEDVHLSINNFYSGINILKNAGNKIAGFAASAKGNTLLNCAGITTGTMSYIVDQTPEKIGKYSPGTHIPIVSMLELERNPPDYLVILSWNFSEEIIDKCRKAGYNGKFIIPIPEFKVIESDVSLQDKNVTLSKVL
jgi:SAM-dependent methyltransferase